MKTGTPCPSPPQSVAYMGQKVEAPRLRDALRVALVGGATLLPFLGQAHSVSSHETRHAEIAREMARAATS